MKDFLTATTRSDVVGQEQEKVVIKVERFIYCTMTVVEVVVVEMEEAAAANNACPFLVR